MTALDDIKELYVTTFGSTPKEIQSLPGAGSDRKYYRLTGKQSVVATVGNDINENKSFVTLSIMFKEAGLNVPHIYAVSDDFKIYIQEDLGDTQLIELLHFAEGERLTAEVMRSLPALQLAVTDGIAAITGQPDFGKRMVDWDLNYFKYEFLKPSGIVFDEDKLQDDFDMLQEMVCSLDAGPVGFMYRDCQSRNVMVHDDKPYWIDYQSGRRGPLLYDLVSFLWQAKAGFTAEERKMYSEIYLTALAELTDFDIEKTREMIPIFALLRTLQVLGAYGFRGVAQGRSHFIESIPMALDNLRELLPTFSEKLPELARVSEELCRERVFCDDNLDHTCLTVTVRSFSYKQGGYPKDWSGNGGGYVFDCRSLPNPGRINRYKPMTGRDEEVKEWLRQYDEVEEFVSAASKMVINAARVYDKRGFNRLEVAFGCTGGRHRSVYSAEQTAKRIAAALPDVRVRVVHREHGIDYMLSGMMAMILAAGLGTRLKPWTLEHPKALVPIGGVPMLERVMSRLKSAGFTRITVNTHHFAEQISDWLAENTPDGMHVQISHEPELLETGGALLAASQYLETDLSPILIHNVDILSDAPLDCLMKHHTRSSAQITLLTSKRESSRKLLFDSDGRLKGWINTQTGETRPEGFHPSPAHTAVAFSGIYVISPVVLSAMRAQGWSGKFSIIDFMLKNVGELDIREYRVDNLKLIDIGKPETLAQSENFI